MEVTASAAAATAATGKPAKPAPETKPALSSDFETFLKMLTTQMQNQDPLNPLESTEFATQLATFSSVEQQTKSNELLASMVAQLGIIGMSQITGWVGMEARTSGPVWVDNRAVSFTPQPATAADRMAIVVRDEGGVQVGRLEMEASDQPMAWTPTGTDGSPLPAGVYSFELESLNRGEVLTTAPLETYARVVEVRNEAGQPTVVLDGGVKIGAAEITALRQPAAGA